MYSSVSMYVCLNDVLLNLVTRLLFTLQDIGFQLQSLGVLRARDFTNTESQLVLKGRQQFP